MVPRPNQTETDPRPSVDLTTVQSRDTVGDLTSIPRIRAELPAGWDVRLDLVQFGTEALEEALTFSRTPADPRLQLKPARFDEPERDVEWHERQSRTAGRRHVRTVPTLDEAVRAAVNWTHQQG